MKKKCYYNTTIERICDLFENDEELVNSFSFIQEIRLYLEKRGLDSRDSKFFLHRIDANDPVFRRDLKLKKLNHFFRDSYERVQQKLQKQFKNMGGLEFVENQKLNR